MLDQRRKVRARRGSTRGTAIDWAVGADLVQYRPRRLAHRYGGDTGGAARRLYPVCRGIEEQTARRAGLGRAVVVSNDRARRPLPHRECG